MDQTMVIKRMLLCLALFMGNTANAALVAFEIEGTITSAFNMGSAGVGDTFTARYEFESTQTGTTYTGNNGSYTFEYTEYAYEPGGLFNYRVSAGGVTIDGPTGSSTIISTRNDYANTGSGPEQYTAISSYNDGVNDHVFSVNLYSTSGAGINIHPVDLLLSSPNLAGIEMESLSYSKYTGVPANDQYFEGTINAFIYQGEVATLNDGDLAPLGAPDGIINAADILIATRLVLGTLTAAELQLAHGDVYPPGAPDGLINLQDLILITQMVLQ